MEKIERLINLTAFLLDSSRPVTLEVLKETVYKSLSASGSSLRRMFERDKQELRDMGIEVRAETAGPDGEMGYTIPREEYYLPELDLDTEERVALMMVSRLFLGAGTAFSASAHSALLKIAFDKKDEGGWEEKVPQVRWVAMPREREVLSDIMEALVKRKRLSFGYRSLNVDEPVDREVEAFGIFHRGGYWYLIGRCLLRGELRCFKLERIVTRVRLNASNPHKPDFSVPEDFDIEKAACWEWPPPRGEEDILARVRFGPRLCFAYSSASAAAVSEEAHEDGGKTVTYEVADPEQFVDWVMEFGADARVESPEELREMVRGRLERVLAAVRRSKDEG